MWTIWTDKQIAAVISERVWAKHFHSIANEVTWPSPTETRKQTDRPYLINKKNGMFSSASARAANSIQATSIEFFSLTIISSAFQATHGHIDVVRTRRTLCHRCLGLSKWSRGFPSTVFTLLYSWFESAFYGRQNFGPDCHENGYRATAKRYTRDGKWQARFMGSSNLRRLWAFVVHCPRT